MYRYIYAINMLYNYINTYLSTEEVEVEIVLRGFPPLGARWTTHT